MALAEEMELDPSRIERRIHFLDQRARAHQFQGEGLAKDVRGEFETACAAALWRDAAALALLLGRARAAQQFLTQAGATFAQIGLFAGFALLSLADPESWQDDYRSELSSLLDVLRGEMQPANIEGKEDAERVHQSREVRSRRPFTQASLGSTRQLSHLYQAFAARRADDKMASAFVELLERRLMETPAAPIGPTGLPLRSYLRAMQVSRHGDFTADTRETLSAVAGMRAEQIRAAQADRYHWRLVLAPSDLIDFDLLAMAAASLAARETIEDIDAPFRRWKGGVDAPFRAAIELRAAAPRTSRI